MKEPWPSSCLKDPCSEVTCSYGSTCVQSSDGQSAKCMCPLSCEGQREQVVCGSDGKDYPSECELNKQACASQKNIRKQHAGPCGYPREGQNSGKNGAGVSDGGAGRRSPRNAPGSRQKRDSEDIQTSLEHTYSSKRTDPCKNNQTHAHKACRVEPRTRRPQTFPLPKSCPPDAVPLCASDGQTYDSGCSMQLTGQLKGIVLRKVHSGQCEEHESCKEECKFNAVCLLDRLGPHCSCEPIRCDGSFKPLCGKDGRTYSNDCERRQAECLAKVHIPVKQQGPCVQSNLLSLCLGGVQSEVALNTTLDSTCDLSRCSALIKAAARLTKRLPLRCRRELTPLPVEHGQRRHQRGVKVSNGSQADNDVCR
ncbi:hypothetical protein Z043_103845 [Scleropages formosus]|uniref:Kazal-like domain-containing protein n=1 Tax=Scleropages formosus TaxID=113540 RepID=A0A0P7V574_SCLFO|nr:hypothetical protein Z043_103845 [Scleropages formosus]